MNEQNIYRVLEDRGTTFLVSDQQGKSWSAQISGNLKKEETENQPTVGDWVEGVFQPGDWIYIEKLLPRKNLLKRQASNGQSLQKLGANIDHLWIATAINQDFNLNRIDRYVAMAFDAGINPVIVLTKADLVENSSEYLMETQERFPFVDTHLISTKEAWNLEELQRYLQNNLTVAIVGSSGVGKSTLVNRIFGREILDTGGIREDDGKGRHTTTHRSLHRLETGAWLMDTPGLRSVALWEAEEGVSTLFQEIEAWAKECKFRDCQHETEPKCRIQEALATGELPEEKWESYLKLQFEKKVRKPKTEKLSALREKQETKAITKSLRQFYKLRGR